ncbi:MAG TPA: hypothetical protein VGM23_06310, partial [Armatimonadota bacterium]
MTDQSLLAFRFLIADFACVRPNAPTSSPSRLYINLPVPQPEGDLPGRFGFIGMHDSPRIGMKMLKQISSTHNLVWRYLPGLALIFALCSALAAPTSPVFAGGGNHLYVAPNIGGNHDCYEVDPCSLSQGIAKASDGDTIHMASGTYLVGTGFEIPSGITMIGPDVPAGNEPVAILDAEHADRVINITAGAKTINLINLVIQNGKVTDENGAGIFCQSFATLSLDHVIVRNNDTLKQNMNGQQGGGIFSSNCTLSIDNSTLSGNTSAGWGGGLAIQGGTAALNDVLILNNAISGPYGYGGGGVSVSPSTTTFDKVTISNNTSSAGAAGLFVNPDTATFTMKNSTVSGNVAVGTGGGMILYNAATIINSTFSNNHTDSIGGAVYLSGTSNGGINTSQGKL